MRKILVSIFAMLFMGLQLVMAQTQVRGTVTDASGLPLPGVGVQVKGVDGGTATNSDGNYTINAASNAVLVFSFMGMKTQEVAVNGRAVVNVVMQEDATVLDEVLIETGYGSARSLGSITGAVSAVKEDKMKDRPVANVADALQGQVAGLQVFSSSGEPSADFSMRLRGVNSINAGNTPLLLVDGVPVTASAFHAINANDIESMVVLKDASATAIYGSRAANGVVILTTKKGTRSEKSNILVKAQYGISMMANDNLPMMNAKEYLAIREVIDPTLLTNASFQGKKEFVYRYNIDTDWKKELFKSNAPTYQIDISTGANTDKINYYLSAGFFSQDGITHHSNLNRMNLRSNIDAKLNDYLKVGVHIGMSHEKFQTTFSTNNGWYNPANYSRWADPSVPTRDYTIDASGNIVWGDEWKFNDELGLWNCPFVMEMQPTFRKMSRLIGGSYIQIAPIKGLTIRAAQSVDAFDWRYSMKAYPDQDFNQLSGTVRELFQRMYSFTFTNTAEYKHTFKDDHNLTFLVGQEAIVTKDENFRADAGGFTDRRLMLLGLVSTPASGSNPFDQAITETAVNSYFGRIEYNFREKYFIDASLRRDASSRFSKSGRWGTFYSLGALWDMKQENFLSGVDFLNSLQLRASYGSTGNSSISDYLYIGALGTNQYNGATGLTIGTVDNKDLTWETVTTLNIGVSGRLFNRLNVELDFYRKLTSDMLLNVPYSYTTGHSSGWGNVGEMSNTGIDASVSYDILTEGDFFWSVTANFNYNKNKIEQLYEGIEDFEVAGTGMKYEVGHSYGEFYYAKYAGVNPANGEQLWYTKDGNITNVYSADHAVFINKQRYAPYAGGFSTQFRWKGISVMADFSYVLGKYSINNDRYFVENSANAASMNMAKSMKRMWQKPGDITDIPGPGQRPEFDSRFVENASFGRLKNLTLSYSFPKNILDRTGFLEGARIYATGRNLITLTDYSGYDPEVDSNLQLGNYPNTRQYQVGVELTF